MLSSIRRRWRSILEFIYISRLPAPTERDQYLLTALRDEVKAIKLIDTKGLCGSELEWSENVNTLFRDISKKDPRCFLTWSVIRNTMFVSWVNYSSIELTSIKKSDDFNRIWRSALIEQPTGKPLRYYKYPLSSENLIHHVYHLSKFKEYVNIEFEKLEIIFEFGGGYGSICRVLHNCNFNKRYIIFDLPVFSALQKYYLKSIGVNVLESNQFNNVQSGIFCISDFEELTRVMESISSIDRKLFLATWSLSEAPILLRQKLFTLFSKFDYYLIAYQEQFGETNNLEYFRQFKERISNIDWIEFEIDHLRKNYYLFGR